MKLTNTEKSIIVTALNYSSRAIENGGDIYLSKRKRISEIQDLIYKIKES